MERDIKHIHFEILKKRGGGIQLSKALQALKPTKTSECNRISGQLGWLSRKILSRNVYVCTLNITDHAMNRFSEPRQTYDLSFFEKATPELFRKFLIPVIRRLPVLAGLVEGQHMVVCDHTAGISPL